MSSSSIRRLRLNGTSRARWDESGPQAASPFSAPATRRRPSGTGLPACEVAGIGSLHDASTRFDRNSDRMCVREERGAGTRLAEQSADQASERSISVTKQQPIPRLPGKKRIQRLVAPGSPVQFGQGACRDRDLAAQPARCLHGAPYLAFSRMPRIKQRVHRFGIEHKSHQPTRRSPGSSALPPSRRMYLVISASSSAVSSPPRSASRWSRRSASARCRFRLVNSARKAEFTSADREVLPSASIAATGPRRG